MLILVDPVTLRLEDYSGDRLSQLRDLLTYTDTKAEFELRKLKRGFDWYKKIGKLAEWKMKKEYLEANLTKCLLNEKDMTVPSGLTNLIAKKFNEKEVINKVYYPDPKVIPWDNIPKFKNRYYQDESEEEFIKIKHGACEICTGAGKTKIIRNLTKYYGLKTVVMTPSVSIAKQILKDFTYHFGKKYVGAFFEGKKDSKKLFVVAVGASLARVVKGTTEYENLSKAQVFIADESHLTPAKTLAEVCFGLVKNAPYRFFLSGTQVRGDGADLLLEGITGKIVYTYTVEQGIKDGFLAKPIFRMVETTSDSPVDVYDANDMTRAHLYFNPSVNQIAADIANKSVEFLNQPVLILVEEVEQLKHLLPYLKHEVGFAHSTLTKENKKNVLKEYHKSDPEKLVDRFNANELPILVGTSCVATGTDFTSLQCIIYLRGGKSEVEVKQGIGRGTRLSEGKDSFSVWDFKVTNVDKMVTHAEAREKIYEEIYGKVESVKWN